MGYRLWMVMRMMTCKQIIRRKSYVSLSTPFSRSWRKASAGVGELVMRGGEGREGREWPQEIRGAFISAVAEWCLCVSLCASLVCTGLGGQSMQRTKKKSQLERLSLFALVLLDLDLDLDLEFDISISLCLLSLLPSLFIPPIVLAAVPSP